MSPVEVRGLRETVRVLREASSAIQAQIPQVMRQATALIVREAKQQAPVDTGRLRSSITDEVRGVALETTGVVGSNVEYAPYVELGTKPHWPPLKSLEVWARRHGTTAYLVARAIARRGTKAHRFLQGAMEEKKNDVIRLFVDFVNRLRF